MRGRNDVLLGISALLLADVASAHDVTIYVQGPDDDWCTFINEEIEPGDMVRLLPGDYYGPCELHGRETDEPSELTMIQALDFQARPRFLHPGDPAVPYVLRLTGQSIALLDAIFEDVPEHAVAVQIEAESSAWVRFDAFRRVAGTAVEILSGTDVRVQDSSFEETALPAVFGCADASCPVGDLVFRGNLLQGGPGAVVHPGASGTVSDNIGAELTTPLVRYHGRGGVIEANLASATGPAIEVLGDDVLVRNNLVIGALALRGAGAEVVGNSIVGDIDPGDTSPAARYNAVTARSVPGTGNVHCSDPAACWEDADGWDFRPVPGGLLHETGDRDDLLPADFCGTARGAPPDVGALERTEGAVGLVVDFKRLQRCTGLGPPEEPPVDTAAPGPVDDGDDSGCGCSGVGAAPVGLGWLVGALLVWGRARRPAVT